MQDFLDNAPAISNLLPPKIFQQAHEHAQACRDRPPPLWLFPGNLRGTPVRLVYERIRGQLSLSCPKGVVIGDDFY